MSNCEKCAKPVFAAEQVQAHGHKFHRACFKCSICLKPLTLSSVVKKFPELFCRSCNDKKPTKEWNAADYANIGHDSIPK